MSSSDIEEHFQSIRNLEISKLRLQDELNSVDLELRHKTAIYHNLRNANLPISKLSNELLIKIFCMTRNLPSKKTSAQPFEVLASHVCSNWLHVVCSTPLLWNRITISVGTRKSMKIASSFLQRLEVQLLRSKPCPLDITVSTYSLEIINALLPHSERWRQLSISIASQSLQPLKLNQLFRVVDAPILEYFSLSMEYRDIKPISPTHGILPIASSIFKGKTPQLSFLHLSGNAAPLFRTQLDYVTTLHFDTAHYHVLTQSQLREFLSQFPSLINLSLGALEFDPSSDSSNSTLIPLHGIQSLRLVDCTSDIRVLFSCIDLPHVHSLILSGVDLNGGIQISGVQSLTLNQSYHNFLEPMREFMQSFPTITELTVNSMESGIFEALTPIERPDQETYEVVSKSLHTFTLRDLDPASVPLFCKMVLVRRARGSPISRFRLDRRTRTVLRAKDYLDWLTGIAEVENYDVWPTGFDDENPFDDVLD